MIRNFLHGGPAAIRVLVFSMCIGLSSCPALAAASDLAAVEALESKAIPLPHGEERLKLMTEAATSLESALQAKDVDKSHAADLASDLGQLFQSESKPAESLHWYQQVVSIRPDDWRAWSKIVQASQALGDTAQRDAAREKILGLNSVGKVDQRMFCREQFVASGKNVMVFEYFKPAQPFNVQYVFLVSDHEGEMPKIRYALGETEADTELARAMKKIGPDDNVYSLDGYQGRTEWLVDMYSPKFPAYEAVRASVVRDLERLASPYPAPPLTGQTH
jgi:tetratricopeptide (TPR) repeat protein